MNNSNYQCFSCNSSLQSSTSYVSTSGDISCNHCLKKNHNFQYILSSLISKIPQNINYPSQFIKTCLCQLRTIKQNVKGIEAKINLQIKTFREKIQNFCDCIEGKVNIFGNKCQKYIKTIERLRVPCQSQPKKIIQFLGQTQFQPDRYKFNIQKDLNLLFEKSEKFDTISLNLPDLKESQKVLKSMTFSDTIINFLKIMKDRIIATTVSGQICIINKNSLQQECKFIAHNGTTIRGLDIYKDMFISASKQIIVWKFNQSGIQQVKTFGVLTNNYRHILVIQKLGIILTCSGQGNSIKLWSIQNNVVASILQGHKEVIKAMINGKQNETITYSSDNTIIIWDIQNRKMLRRIFHHETISHMDYDPRLQMIVVFDGAHWVTVYNYGFELKPMVSSKWKLSRLTTTLLFDWQSKIITSKFEAIRVFDIFGNKKYIIDIGKRQFTCMIVEYDRVYAGTGRGQIVCSQFVGNSSLLV